MAKADFTLHSVVVARVELDPAAVRGDGGATYPRLVLPLNFKFSPAGEAKQDLWFLGLHVQMSLQGGTSKIADATAKPFFRLVGVEAVEQNADVDVEFPLNHHRIELIEQHRRGDVLFRCDLYLTAARFGEPRFDVERCSNLGPCVTDFQTIYTTLNFEVLQSVWIKNVLPGLGCGVVHVLEFPAVSLAACRELQHSYQALERAHAKFVAGEYDEAVWQCRTAVEPLRDDLKKIRDGRAESLSTDWAEKVGSTTIDWLVAVLGKTWGVANTPTHSPRTGHFSRLDAQMILTVTSSVVAYVARTKASDVEPT
ncbi:MAG: hypothetical protein KGS61_14225 [Verrucomicrobia bacterium]|nr:hypothetical protein [Verrucomicrobiota bacterium]